MRRTAACAAMVVAACALLLQPAVSQQWFCNRTTAIDFRVEWLNAGASGCQADLNTHASYQELPECRDGYCSGDTCVANKDLGDTCDPSDISSCANDEYNADGSGTYLLCVANDSGNSGTCRYKNSLGDGCEMDSDCKGARGIAYKCTNNVCAGPKASGQSCDKTFADPAMSCGAGLYCNQDTEVCTAQVGLDQDCTSADQCPASSSCTQVTSSSNWCTAFYSLALNDAAAAGFYCRVGNLNDGVCSADRMGGTGVNAPTGGACEISADCRYASDVCVCSGNNAGTCAVATSPTTTAAKAYFDCVRANCPEVVATNRVNANSCAWEHCSAESIAASCAEADSLAVLASGGGSAAAAAIGSIQDTQRPFCSSASRAAASATLLGLVALAVTSLTKRM